MTADVKVPYDVILTRDTTESTVISVEASSEEEACEIAMDRAGRYGQYVLGWTVDEGNMCELSNADASTAWREGYE